MKREATGTLSSEALRVLALAGQGIDLCARFGLEPALLADPDARVPVSTVVRIWDELPIAIGDDAFGLHLAELAAAAPLGLGGQLIQSAPTLGHGLDRMLAFERVFHDVRQSELIRRGDRARLRHDPRGMRMPRHAIEFGWAWLVLVARRITGTRVTPLAVAFAHPAPKSKREHARIFGVAPAFDAAMPEVVLSARDLDRASRGCDPALGAVLESHARLLHARLPASDSILDRARATLHAAMLEGDVSLAGLARRMEMSTRTLQRALAGEGTTHQGMLDELRHEVAVAWLADPHVSIAEIAFGLGFAEVSAFHRAFVRWTKSTPGRWRAGASSVARGDKSIHAR